MGKANVLDAWCGGVDGKSGDDANNFVLDRMSPMVKILIFPYSVVRRAVDFGNEKTFFWEHCQNRVH